MTYADDALAIMTDMLGTLDDLASKAAANGLTDSILAARLVDDMFPLETQFRIANNQVRLALTRTCAHDVALDEEPYEDWAAVRERIAAARAELAKAPANCWAASDATVDMTLPNGMRFVMRASEYLRDWILPNLYFHVTMAYALLRREGMPLGKADFIPHMARYARRSPE